MRAMHDLGSVEPAASGHLDRDEQALTQLDKNVDVLIYPLFRPLQRVIRVDELRRAIERALHDLARIDWRILAAPLCIEPHFDLWQVETIGRWPR